MTVFFSPVVLVWFCLAVFFRYVIRSFFVEGGHNPNRRRPKEPTALPVVTSTGRVLTTVEELDERLEILREELRLKEEKLAGSEKAIKEAEKELRKMKVEARGLARQYSCLDVDVKNAAEECRALRREIREFVERKERARREFNEGLKYYTKMLTDESLKDFEVVPGDEEERGAKAGRPEIAELIEKYRIL